MEQLMIVEIYEEGKWKVLEFKDLEPGMKFRVWDPLTELLFVGDNGDTEFIASGHPYENEEGAATIDIVVEKPSGFECGGETYAYPECQNCKDRIACSY